MSSAPQVFYDVASSRLDEQVGRIDALDAKAATAFGFSAALLPIFGVFFATSNPPNTATALYSVALIVYIALLVVTSRAYGVSGWSFRPDLATLEGHSKTRPEDDVRLWAAEECVRSITANEPRLRLKATYAKTALILLAVDAVVLSVAALATLG
jgi:hypothetical protein